MTGTTTHGRLAELTISLSLASDLGVGQPLEHGLRTCWLSVCVADALGLDAEAASSVYYVALLRFLGCTSDAPEAAVFAGGDDNAMSARLAPVLYASAGEGLRYFLRHHGEDLSLARRARVLARALADPGAERRALTAHCEAGSRLANRLGMPSAVCDALAHAYERWDGKGPDRLEGADIPLPIRIVAVARDAELWARHADWAQAADVLVRRRGDAYDPAVVDALTAGGRDWLRVLDDDPCAAVLDAEPAPVRTIGDDDLETALGAVADFADLKSTWFLGHSTRVAELAGAAAAAAGLSDAAATTVRRAGLVHDVGKVGVPTGIWDRPGPLTNEQWERVRLHPYVSERVLGRCELLAPYAELAGRHHERADASGYHRSVGGDQLGLDARLLAAADCYVAMGEDRPHRPALDPAALVSALCDEVDAGRLGRAEVDAVLAAAGTAGRPPQVDRPAGLTEREVDVLRLIARGHTNKQTAAALGVSPKTVGHHVEHIYAKAGVTTRAGAAVFAMEHGLLSR